MAADNPWNVPNAITLLRVALSFVVFAAMDRGAFGWGVTLLFLFTVITDVVDGYIARKYQLITTFGRIVDPLADKWIICGVFLFLLPHADSGVTPWMAATVFGRELLVTTLRSWLEQRGKDFSAAASGKLKMFLQSVSSTVCLFLLQPAERVQLPQHWLAPWRDGLLWLMVVVTVYSGAVYVVRGWTLLRTPALPPEESQ